MTSEERIQQSAVFIALANELFDAGNNMAGAEMLYGALTQVIIAIAMRRREHYREHQHRRHLIRRLTAELDDPDITDAFGTAQRLHVHFYLNDLTDDCFQAAVVVTHGLINRLLPLAA